MVGAVAPSAVHAAPATGRTTFVHPFDDSQRDSGISVMTPPAAAPVRARADIRVVRVVLSEQRAYVYSGDRRLIATLLVSTGLKDSTPVGRFRVFSKSAKTYYTPRPEEKMRWMVRFIRSETGGHIGFHSIPYRVENGREVKFPTPVGVAPSSHGCVRVRDADAKWLFDNMALGAVVIVQRTRA